jgi:N-methylhydantoinase B
MLEAVRNGYVSLASAQRDYGVVIDSTTMIVDEAATTATRQGGIKE